MYDSRKSVRILVAALWIINSASGTATSEIGERQPSSDSFLYTSCDSDAVVPPALRFRDKNATSTVNISADSLSLLCSATILQTTKLTTSIMSCVDNTTIKIFMEPASQWSRISCQSEALIKVQVEFIYDQHLVYDDNLFYSQRQIAFVGKNGKEEWMNTVTFSPRGRRSARYTITGTVENKSNGKLRPWTIIPVTILILYAPQQQQPEITAADAYIYDPPPHTFEQGVEDTILIPCMTGWPEPGPARTPLIYQVLNKNDICKNTTALHAPAVSYDMTRGVSLNTSLAAGTDFLCCRPAPKTRAACSSTSCTPFSIQPTGRVVHRWNWTTQDDESPTTGAGVLRLVEVPPPLQTPTAWPSFKCFSHVYENVSLTVLRCHNAQQCHLLSECFGPRWCGLTYMGHACKAKPTGAVSCKEMQAPSPGGLIHCTGEGHSYTQLRWLGLSSQKSYLYLADRASINVTELQREMILLKQPDTAFDLTTFKYIYYTNMSYRFRCQLHPFWSAGRVRFYVGFSGGQFQKLDKATRISDINETTSTDWPFDEKVELFISSTTLERVVCEAPLFDTEYAWIRAEAKLDVVASTKPVILSQDSEVYLEDDGEFKLIPCEVTGRPPPLVSWRTRSVDGKWVAISSSSEAEVRTINNGTTLKFEKFTKELQDTYRCVAMNAAGETLFDFHVLLPPAVPVENMWPLWVGLGVSALGFLVLVTLVLSAYFRCLIFKRKRILDQEDLDRILYGAGSAQTYTNEHAGNNAVVEAGADVEAAEAGANVDAVDVEVAGARADVEAEADAEAEVLLGPIQGWLADLEIRPFDQRFIVQRKHFRIDISRRLGSGKYGKVYEGILLPRNNNRENKKVAIKVPKRFCPEGDLLQLLKELRIMTHLQHENIVRLRGAEFTGAIYGEIYILMELCDEGSLEQFFERNRSGYESGASAIAQKPNSSTNGHYYSLEDLLIRAAPTQRRVRRFNISHLLQWCLDVATGMEFLASLGLLHRDLAARNVLLTSSMQAKVGDFGLSRQLYGALVYQQQNVHQRLPLCWLAIECFNGVFTSASDVWAFGILAWEIFSLGAVPYGSWNFQDAQELAELLLEGERITEPYHAPPEIFTIVQNCWDENPATRPSFTRLREAFTGLEATGELVTTQITQNGNVATSSL